MRDYSDYKTPNVGTLKDQWEDVTKGFRDVGSAIKGWFDKIKSIPQRREQKLQKQMEQGQKRFDAYINNATWQRKFDSNIRKLSDQFNKMANPWKPKAVKKGKKITYR